MHSGRCKQAGGEDKECHAGRVDPAITCHWRRQKWHAATKRERSRRRDTGVEEEALEKSWSARNSGAWARVDSDLAHMAFGAEWYLDIFNTQEEGDLYSAALEWKIQAVLSFA
jgi:hypothetical protein